MKESIIAKIDNLYDIAEKIFESDDASIQKKLDALKVEIQIDLAYARGGDLPNGGYVLDGETSNMTLEEKLACLESCIINTYKMLILS